MIRDAAAGRMPAYIDTGLNMVHVDDVAEGHALALESGRIGERYILGGENLLLKDILALVADVVGRRPPQDRAARGRGLAGRLVHGGAGAAHRHPADDDARPPEDGAEEDVLLLGQGDARARLRAAPGARGDRGRGRLVPRQRHAARMTTLAALSLLIWLYLLLAHGRFWQSGPELAPARPAVAPPVAVVVPARDEAAVIGQTLRSLLAQDYAGPFRVILVDDGSSDGTGAIARGIGDPRLTVLDGRAAPGRLERQAVGGRARAGRGGRRRTWCC